MYKETEGGGEEEDKEDYACSIKLKESEEVHIIIPSDLIKYVIIFSS